MNTSAKTIIFILIINGSIAEKIEEDRQHLDFGRFSLKYHPSKSALDKSDKMFELERVSDAVNHHRDYNKITRVYFCEDGNSTYDKVRSFGVEFSCNLPISYDNKDGQSSPSISFQEINGSNSKIKEGYLWNNKLWCFEQNWLKEYKNFYWPLQNCWEEGKCVSCNEQAIFLFKTDKASIVVQHEINKCNASDITGGIELINGIKYLMNNTWNDAEDLTDNDFYNDNTKDSRSLNEQRTNLFIPAGAEKQDSTSKLADNNPQAQVQAQAKRSTNMSKYSSPDQFAVHENTPKTPKFGQLIV